jgi:cell division protein FtsL
MILRLLILWAVIASAIGLAVLIHRTRKTADGDDPLITG